MPFLREVITRDVVVFVCPKCKARREYANLNFGEIATCEKCNGSESFTGKEQIKYDIIHSSQSSLLMRALNNPWIVSILVALIIIIRHNRSSIDVFKFLL